MFGEQPSAAKWNQLGENDAGFKDGTNIDPGAITTPKLNDGSVTPAKRSGGFYATVWDASAEGTGTGKEITGIGFTPKAFIVVGNQQTSAGAQVSTSGYCYDTGSGFTQGSQASAKTNTEGRTIQSATQAFLGTTQSTTVFEGAVTGFSDGTITVNITTNSGADYSKFHIVVFG